MRAEETTARQWREAAIVLREQAVKLDAYAAEAERAERRSSPDPERKWATVYERAAWMHDIGEHSGSDFPYGFCPRCEMEHPLGRFRVLLAAAQAVVKEWDERGDGGCTKTLQDQLREAVNGKPFGFAAEQAEVINATGA